MMMMMVITINSVLHLLTYQQSNDQLQSQHKQKEEIKQIHTHKQNTKQGNLEIINIQALQSFQALCDKKYKLKKQVLFQIRTSTSVQTTPECEANLAERHFLFEETTVKIEKSPTSREGTVRRILSEREGQNSEAKHI
jgi:hypothetical protein